MPERLNMQSVRITGEAPRREPEPLRKTNVNIVGEAAPRQFSPGEQAMLDRGIPENRLPALRDQRSGDFEGNLKLHRFSVEHALQDTFPGVDPAILRTARNIVELERRDGRSPEQIASFWSNVVEAEKAGLHGASRERINEFQGMSLAREILSVDENGAFRYPAVRALMSDPEASLLVKGQEAELIRMEDYHRRMFGGTLSKVGNRLYRGAISTLDNLITGSSELVRWGSDAVSDAVFGSDDSFMSLEEIRAAGIDLGTMDESEREEAVREWMEVMTAIQSDEEFRNRVDAELQDFSSRAIPETGGEGVALDAVEALPNFLTQVGLTILTKNPYVGMGFVGTTSYGGTYSSLEAAGVEEGIRRRGALVSAVGQSALARIPSGGYARLTEPLSSSARAGLGRAILRTGGNILSNAAKESVEESLQATWETVVTMAAIEKSEGGSIGDALADYIDELPRHSRDAAYRGLIGGILGGITGLANIRREIRHDRAVRARADHFNEMAAQLQSSTIGKESPDTAAQFAQHLEGEGASVSVPGDVFLQSLAPLNRTQRKALLDGLHVSEAEVQEAANTGGVITVSKADALVHMSDDVRSAILEDASFDGEMSIRETMEARQNLRQLTQEYRDAILRMQDESASPERIQTFRDEVLAVAKDGFTAEYADAVSALLLARATRAASDWGMTTDEWLTKMNVHVRAGESGVEMVAEGMREAAQNQAARGNVTFGDTATVIRVFERGDRSTIVHELAHVFVRDMESMIESGMAPEVVMQDYQTLVQRFGKDGKLDQNAHETIAPMFEKYVATGHAPSPELMGVFRKLKDWFTSVYRSIIGSPLDRALPDDVRGVFDRMLASSDQIDVAADAYAMAGQFVDAEAMRDASAQSKNRVARTEEEALALAKERRVKHLREAFIRAVGGLPELRSSAMETVKNDPRYKAIRDIRENGGASYEDIAYFVGEEVAARIRDAHGKGIVPIRVLQDVTMIDADGMVFIPTEASKEAIKGTVYDGHNEVVQSENLETLQKHIVRLENEIERLEQLMDRKTIRRSKTTEHLFQRYEMEFENSEMGAIYRVRMGFPYSIRLREGNIVASNRVEAQTLLNKLLDSAWSSLADTEGARYLDVAHEIADRAMMEMPTRKDAERMRREWIVAGVANEINHDLQSGIESLVEMLNQTTEQYDRIDALESELYPVVSERIQGTGKVVLSEIAAKHGFESIESLLDAMADAPRQSQQIRNIVNEKLEALTSKLESDMDADTDILSVDKSVETKIAEAQLLEESIEAQGRKVKRKANHQAMKQAVNDIMAQKTVRAAQAHYNYMNAAKKYSALALQAANKGDAELAHDYKMKEVMQLMLANQAVKNRDMVRKSRATMLRYAKSQGVHFEYQDNIKAILGKFNLKPKTMKVPEEYKPLSSLPDPQDHTGERRLSDLVSDFILGEGADFRTLTMAQFAELHDTVVMLGEIGREGLRFLKSERAQTEAEYAQGMAESLSELSVRSTPEEGSLAFKAQKAWANIVSNTVQFQYVFSEIDGFSDLRHEAPGMAQNLYLSMKVADDNRKVHMNQLQDTLKPHFETLNEFVYNFQKQHGKRGVEIPELPMPRSMVRIGRHRWTAERILTAMLNLGNEGNANALVEGYGWGNLDPVEVRRILASHMTEAELRAIQGIWDVVTGMYDGLNEAHINTYHKPMAEEVKPEAFTVRTRDGQYIQMEGGYYPISLDGKLSLKGGEMSEADIMKNSMTAALHLATPNKSFTKQRTGTKLPVRLEMGVLTQHLDAATRFQHLSGIVGEANRVFRHEGFRDAFIEHFGHEMYDQLTPWLSAFARTDFVPLGTFDRFLRLQKDLMTVATLGFNTRVGVMQRLSLFTAANKVGVWRLIKAHGKIGIRAAVYGEAWGKKSAAIQAIHALSPTMAYRYLRYNRDISDFLNKINPLKRSVKLGGKLYSWGDLKDIAFEWIKANDLATTYAVWQAAFDQAMDMESGMVTPDMDPETRQRQAALYADKIVRETQPSSDPEDLSAVQRSHGVARALTVFSTFTMKHGNLARQYGKALEEGKISKAEWVRWLALDFLGNSYGKMMLAAWFAGSLAPEEWQEVVYAPISTALSWVPLARDLEGALRYNRGMGEVGALDGFNRGVKAIRTGQRTMQGEADFLTFLYDLAKAVEFQTGTPALRTYERSVRDWNAIKKMLGIEDEGGK